MPQTKEQKSATQRLRRARKRAEAHQVQCEAVHPHFTNAGVLPGQCDLPQGHPGPHETVIGEALRWIGG